MQHGFILTQQVCFFNQKICSTPEPENHALASTPFGWRIAWFYFCGKMRGQRETGRNIRPAPAGTTGTFSASKLHLDCGI